jgi:glycosyltransferase involved in cell wall biosynthesis
MISVIIPTYNDEKLIKTTISHLKQHAYVRLLKEIIVVDAGSCDRTVREAEAAGASVVRSIRKERGFQMNLGAQYATGTILYFLVPGTLPPQHFTNEIVRATQRGYSFGSFTMGSESKNWILKGLSWLTQKVKFTRLDGQSLFIVKELFEKGGQFREDMSLLEDREMIDRLRRYSSYVILKDRVVASTKKYAAHGVFRTELSYLTACAMYILGYPQEKFVKVYKFMLGETVEQTSTQGLRASLS